MRRSISVLSSLTLLSLVALAPERAAAAPPIGGTASCSLQGRWRFLPSLPLTETPTGSKVSIRGKLVSMSCDGSGVTGASETLREAIVDIGGRMPAGTECSSFLDAIAFEKGALRVRWLSWRTVDGHKVTLGKSKATIASAAFDEGSSSFVITTAPIAKGAFVGATLAFAMPIRDVVEYTRICNVPNGGAFASFNWGPPLNDNSVTLSVQ